MSAPDPQAELATLCQILGCSRGQLEAIRRHDHRARKRAARRDLWGVPRCLPPVDEDARDLRRAYMKMRRFCLIGQRLRPCSGCPDCDPQCPVDGPLCADLPVCDGSGVLSARRAM